MTKWRNTPILRILLNSLMPHDKKHQLQVWLFIPHVSYTNIWDESTVTITNKMDQAIKNAIDTFCETHSNTITFK